MEQVVMLPTNEKSLNSVFSLRSDKPYLMSEQNSPFTARIYDTKDLYHTYFNLYIISDDEIKLFDWVYNNKENIVEQITSKTQLIFVLEENKENQTFKKIIATTDTSLEIKNELWSAYQGRYEADKLPQPSQQFIEKYIEEYNKGNIITDVLVEYELISNEEYFGNTFNPDDDVPYFDENLKINPKDNTITIKKVKDSYSREEVIGFGNKVKEYCKDGWKSDSLHRVFFEWDKWIEENL